MTDFEQLLKKFALLPRARRTFMQIAGYPHYENVCSNILAFFLDPENEHGFGNLLLVAFLACLEKQFHIASVKVEREVPFEGKYLDLLITSDAFVLGIENKIFHHVANPLHIYRKGIETRRANDDQAVLAIVLSPAPTELTKMKESGFRSVTYAELFAQLKALIGDYIADADVTYLIYLNGFIKTIESLMGTNIENQQSTAFFQEHGLEIEALGKQYEIFRETQINILRSYLPSFAALDGPGFDKIKGSIKVESRITGDLKLSYKFVVESINFEMDTAWYGNQWRTAFFPKSIPLDRIIEQLDRQPELKNGIQKTKFGGSYISDEKASVEEVAKDVNMLLTKIIDLLSQPQNFTGT